MADSERDRKSGIRYYAGTRIHLGTTVRINCHPLYQVQGGSEDIDPSVVPEELGRTEKSVGPNIPRLLQVSMRHSIYSSPSPLSAERTRYVGLGGWQNVQKADRDKGPSW